MDPLLWPADRVVSRRFETLHVHHSEREKSSSRPQSRPVSPANPLRSSKPNLLVPLVRPSSEPDLRSASLARPGLSRPLTTDREPSVQQPTRPRSSCPQQRPTDSRSAKKLRLAKKQAALHMLVSDVLSDTASLCDSASDGHSSDGYCSDGHSSDGEPYSRKIVPSVGTVPPTERLLNGRSQPSAFSASKPAALRSSKSSKPELGRRAALTVAGPGSAAVIAARTAKIQACEGNGSSFKRDAADAAQQASRGVDNAHRKGLSAAALLDSRLSTSGKNVFGVAAAGQLAESAVPPARRHRPAWGFPGHRRAQAAHTHPRAPPTLVAGLLWPQQLASGRPKVADFPLSFSH